MAGPRRDLELKALDRDPARSLRVCEGLGASDEGRLVQTDTYFAAANGRPKLREQDGAETQLIAYERADHREQPESRYEIVAVPDAGEDPSRFAGPIRNLRTAFAIADEDLAPSSYCDLLIASSSAAS